jgi:putative phosphoribosyl transferase
MIPVAGERGVRIESDGAVLKGDLTLPAKARGLVLFAHGSGSGRLSPRNRHVAAALQQRGLATLLFDLLTGAEESAELPGSGLRFDIPFLARRLAAATSWARSQDDVGPLPLSYFGASTGAAAALMAAAEEPSIAAVVSRGGRPDLAGDALEQVRAPTLLIVGGRDREVLELNRLALARLASREKELVVVPGASHLFEEPGALEEVVRLAGAWLLRHAVAPASAEAQVP